VGTSFLFDAKYTFYKSMKGYRGNCISFRTAPNGLRLGFSKFLINKRYCYVQVAEDTAAYALRHS